MHFITFTHICLHMHTPDFFLSHFKTRVLRQLFCTYTLKKNWCWISFETIFTQKQTCHVITVIPSNHNNGAV